MKKKSEIAVDLFKQGFNCSQSVFGAYAENFGIDINTALRLAASFGGGMGRMREVCGALSGGFLVAGLVNGSTDGKDSAGKKANYDLVQNLAKKFKEENGSIYCRELLGLTDSEKSERIFSETKPEERTSEYYEKRPCVEIIEKMCNMIDDIL